MSNKFNKTESRILVYGPEWNYAAVECNNKEAVEASVKAWGMPNVYMKNFDTWQEMALARKCYEWMLSASPKAKQNVERPTDAELDWFWDKKLNDEYYDISEAVAKYDDMLPETPDRYKVKISV